MSKGPFFIVGVQRSGTTLLSLMVASHSLIAIPYESHFITEYYSKRGSFGDLASNPDARINLVKSILNERFVANWDKHIMPEDIDLSKCVGLEQTIDQIYTAYARKHGKTIWGDKTPAYITDIHILNRMFPTAKFIHIIRDGRDVALSIMKTRWGVDDFVLAVKEWVKCVECARKMLAMLPDNRSMELRYEDLVTYPAEQIRRITDFLQIAFEDVMLDGYRAKARERIGGRMEIHPNITDRPSISQTYKWMKTLHPADQAIAFELAGDLLKELGYPEGIKRHPLKIFRKFHLLIKESLRWRTKRFIYSLNEHGGKPVK